MPSTGPFAPTLRRGLLVALGLTVFALTVYPRDGWLLDDALIYQNFVRSAASGGGFAYGPLGPPVEGYSSPLWTLLLTVLALTGAGGLLAAKAVGTAFGALTVVLVAILPMRASPFWLRTGSVMLVAALPALGWWAASGLETPLNEFLILALLAAMIVDKPLLVAASGGLLAVTRPEGLFFTAIGAGWLAWQKRRFMDFRALARPKARLLVALALLAVPALFWQAYRLRTYDSWFANSALAKLGPGPYVIPDVARGESLAYIAKSFVHLAGPWMTFVVALALAFVGRQSLEPSTARVGCFAIVATGLFLTFGAHADWMPYSRLIVPLVPAMVIALDLCWRKGYAAVAGCALALGFGFAMRESWLDFSPQHAERSGRSLLASYTPARRPFRDPIPADFGGYFYPFYLARYTAPGDRVLIPDVGQAGYLANDVEVLDQFGLVSLTERRYINGEVSELDMLAHLSNPLPSLAFVVVKDSTGESTLRVPKPLWEKLHTAYTIVDRRYWWSKAFNMLVFVRNDVSDRDADRTRFDGWIDRARGVAYPADQILGSR